MPPSRVIGVNELEVVEVLAEEVDLKDKVDVIVSEWMLGSWVCYRLG